MKTATAWLLLALCTALPVIGCREQQPAGTDTTDGTATSSRPSNAFDLILDLKTIARDEDTYLIDLEFRNESKATLTLDDPTQWEQYTLVEHLPDGSLNESENTPPTGAGNSRNYTLAPGQSRSVQMKVHLGGRGRLTVVDGAATLKPRNRNLRLSVGMNTHVADWQKKKSDYITLQTEAAEFTLPTTTGL